jgi:hypothetical protein
MTRPKSDARQTAEQLAAAGADPVIVQNAIGESYQVSERTARRIMAETQTEVMTLEASLARLKQVAIRAEHEGNYSACIAAHRAIRETMRELRLARSFEDLGDGEDTFVF